MSDINYVSDWLAILNEELRRNPTDEAKARSLAGARVCKAFAGRKVTYVRTNGVNDATFSDRILSIRFDDSDHGLVIEVAYENNGKHEYHTPEGGWFTITPCKKPGGG